MILMDFSMMWNIRYARFLWQIDYRWPGGDESIYTPHKQHDMQYVGNSVLAKYVSIVTDVEDLVPNDTDYL